MLTNEPFRRDNTAVPGPDRLVGVAVVTGLLQNRPDLRGGLDFLRHRGVFRRGKGDELSYKNYGEKANEYDFQRSLHDPAVLTVNEGFRTLDDDGGCSGASVTLEPNW